MNLSLSEMGSFQPLVPGFGRMVSEKWPRPSRLLFLSGEARGGLLSLIK